MSVEQGTKQPEAGPWHKCTQMFTVVIDYPKNCQIRVIKLIRGTKVLKFCYVCNRVFAGINECCWWTDEQDRVSLDDVIYLLYILKTL